MLLNRQQVLDIGECIKRIKNKNVECSIELKYKILKIEKSMEEEISLTKQLIDELILKYAELSPEGNPIVNEQGGVSIKKECVQELQEELNKFYKIDSQFPDIYFSIEELEGLQLDWQELECFLPLVKVK